MKKLLIGTYMGCADYSDVTTSTWTIGMYTNETDLISAVNQEFENDIDNAISNKFDEDDDPEEIEEFKDEFDVRIYEKRQDKLMEASLVGELDYLCDTYHDTIKVYVIQLEEEE